MLKIPKKAHEEEHMILFHNPFTFWSWQTWNLSVPRDKRHRLPINYSASKDCRTSYNIPYSFLNFSNASPYGKGGQMGLTWIIPAAIHSLKADYKPSFYYKDISHAPPTPLPPKTKTKAPKHSLHGNCEFMLCKIWKSFRIKLKLMT